MSANPLLFSGFRIKGLSLKNRVTMAPLYLSYANPDGSVSQLILDHYREMAASGAAMIVVENTAVDQSGLGSPFMLRADHDRFIPGLASLAEAIKSQGARAFLQINHTGRYAYLPERLAPSPFPTGRVIPRAMTSEQIERTIEAFAAAAGRVKRAGFDGLEIHGGTGYLLVQFLSPRTNQRTDEYGGPLANRMRFPLRVVEAVLAEAGPDWPVGYRFLADEELPEGLHTAETSLYARELARRGVAYLSVMSGTYDSFYLPEQLRKEKEEAYMASWAGKIKEAVPATPVITAGRIQSPETAERILAQGQADLIGLARVLLADPLWPKKAGGELTEPIVRCEPNCSLCAKRITKGKPALCSQWPQARRQAFLAQLGEEAEEA